MKPQPFRFASLCSIYLAFVLTIQLNSARADENFLILAHLAPTLESHREGNQNTIFVPTARTLGFDSRISIGVPIDAFVVGITTNFFVSSQSIDQSSAFKKNVTRFEAGPTFGYQFGHLQFYATYLAYSSLVEKTITTESNLDSTLKNFWTSFIGFQVSASYFFQLAPGVEIGPTLLYRQVRYSHLSQDLTNRTATSSTGLIGAQFSNEVDLGLLKVVAELQPMLSLKVLF